jgi:adenylate cyclase
VFFFNLAWAYHRIRRVFGNFIVHAGRQFNVRDWHWSKWLNNPSNRIRAACFGIGILAAAIVVLPVPVLTAMLNVPENGVHDAFLRERNDLSRAVGAQPNVSDVVIVTIDDESVRALGAYPPFPRQLYAQVCRSIEEAGADVVGFDMVFDGGSPLFRNGMEIPPQLAMYVKESLNQNVFHTAERDDQALFDEFKKHKNVVIASQVDIDLAGLTNGGNRRAVKFVTPYAPFVSALGGKANCLGNLLVEPDADGVVRNTSIGGTRFPLLSAAASSFAVKVVEKKRNQIATNNRTSIGLGSHEFPQEFRINFAGPAGTFQTVPFWKALQWRKYCAEDQGAQQADLGAANPFRHKIVMVGYQDLSPEEAGDASSAIRTPSVFSGYPTSLGGTSQPMSVAEIEANVIQNLVSGNVISKSNWWQSALIFLLFGAGMGVLLSRQQYSGRFKFLTTVVFSTLWFIVCFAVFAMCNFLLPTVTPLIAVVVPCMAIGFFYQRLVVQPDRLKHTRLFHTIASAALAQRIDSEELEPLHLHGKRVPVTVLVCQVRNIEELVQEQSPEESVRKVDEVFRAISACVIEYGGIIERTLNHGLVAVWGAPLESSIENQTSSAAQCAMALRGKWVPLAEGESASRVVPLVSLGINSGVALCGVVGTGIDARYSVLGETVNRAIALSAGTCRVQGQCLVGLQTAEALAGKFVTRQVIQLDSDIPDTAGAKEELEPTIFELIAPEGQMSAVLEEATSLYRQALAAIVEGDYAGAERLLIVAQGMVPDDGPTRQALERCRRSKEMAASGTAQGPVE